MKFSFKKTILSFDRTLIYKLGVFILLYLVLIFGGILPSLKEGKELKQLKGTSATERTRALNKAKHADELAQNRLQIEAVLKDISDRVASEKQMKNMVSAISEMAAESSVKITEVSPIDFVLETDESFEKFCRAHSYELLLEAGYHAFGKFLEKIETNHHIIRVVDLKIIPDAKNSKTHKVSLTLSIFSKKEDLLTVYKDPLLVI